MWGVGKSASQLSPRPERDPAREQTDLNPTAEKNFVWEIAGRPYRKPTQVDEKSILRCSSEPWSRNSAN